MHVRIAPFEPLHAVAYSDWEKALRHTLRIILEGKPSGSKILKRRSKVLTASLETPFRFLSIEIKHFGPRDFEELEILQHTPPPTVASVLLPAVGHDVGVV